METKTQIARILIDKSSGIPFGRLLKNPAAQGWGDSHRSWHCLLEGCQAGPTEPEAPPHPGAERDSGHAAARKARGPLLASLRPVCV